MWLSLSPFCWLKYRKEASLEKLILSFNWICASVCLSLQGCRSCAEGTGGNYCVLSYPEHLKQQGGTKHCTLGREYLHGGEKGES